MTLGDTVASIYRRPRSRFFWIKFRDPATGEVRYQSTGIDAQQVGAMRKARAIEAEKTRLEMSTPRTNERESWQAWAEPYLRERYAVPGTLKSALISLRDLMAFFREFSIRTPRQLTYTLAAQFMPWRLSSKTLDPIEQNTARLRFTYLSVLMQEAVRRGFADFNPCRDVKIRKTVPREKLEISEAHERLIEEELRDRPQWMRDQWLILMSTGCRIAETNVPLSRITADTITFRIKGGRFHTAGLSPNLLPLVEQARAAGRETLLDAPAVDNWSPMWSQLFAKLGLPYSIHCTRVTVITRLIRLNFSPARICAMIGHTEAVNVIYRRLKPRDTDELLAALARAPIPSRDSH